MRHVRRITRLAVLAVSLGLAATAFSAADGQRPPMRTLLAEQPRYVAPPATTGIPEGLVQLAQKRATELSKPEPAEKQAKPAEKKRVAKKPAAESKKKSRRVAAETTSRERSADASPKESNVRVAATGSGDLARARKLLQAQIRRYPILKGTTVEFGDARGYQAIAYYRSGRIVISRTHTASLSRIIAHEVWHIIDWRDNNRMDWGEDVPR